MKSSWLDKDNELKWLIPTGKIRWFLHTEDRDSFGPVVADEISYRIKSFIDLEVNLWVRTPIEDALKEFLNEI